MRTVVRRVHVRRVAAVLLGAACAEGQPTPRADTAAAGGAAGVPAVDTGAGQSKPWRTVAWRPYAGVDPGDFGVGVVYLRAAEDKRPRQSADTLLLRSAPNASAAPVGVAIFTAGPYGEWSYHIAAPDSLRPNLLEHGYEESGVPFDSTDASGNWVRGILGFAADGSPRTGWIDTRQAGVSTLRWAEQLTDRPLFFPRPDEARFFAAPDSARPAAPPRAGVDYAVHPIEARGPWLRVRVVQPSDDCVGPDSLPRETRTLWIRYLDDRGRPNVWYYTRGC